MERGLSIPLYSVGDRDRAAAQYVAKGHQADRFLQQTKLINYLATPSDGTARFARLQGEELVKGMLSCRETQLAGRFVVADSLRVARG
jgi:hypothetical protein